MWIWNRIKVTKPTNLDKSSSSPSFFCFLWVIVFKCRKMKPRTGTTIDPIEWTFPSKKSRVLFVFRGCTVWYYSKLHFCYQCLTTFVQETQNFDTNNKKKFTHHSSSPWFVLFFFLGLFSWSTIWVLPQQKETDTKDATRRNTEFFSNIRT